MHSTRTNQRKMAQNRRIFDENRAVFSSLEDQFDHDYTDIVTSSSSNGVLSFGDVSDDYIDYYNADSLPEPITSPTPNHKRLLDDVDLSDYTNITKIVLEPQEWDSRDFFIETVGGKVWLVPLAIAAGVVVGVLCWLLWVSILKMSVESRRKAKRLIRSHSRGAIFSPQAVRSRTHPGDIPVTLLNHSSVLEGSTSSRSGPTNQEITLAIDNMEMAMDNMVREIQSRHEEPSRSSTPETGKSSSPVLPASESDNSSSSSSSVISVQSVVHREDTDEPPIDSRNVTKF
eukprot:TCALIF_08282-PA protein Name:"Protein of unknown function" AED:0.10 eAED:0.10 QI:0/0/0.5/0.5/1/1/2/79/286